MYSTLNELILILFLVVLMIILNGIFRITEEIKKTRSTRFD